ncbi:hypothetical protein HK405_003273 [Cladochytrium tenue]|nr:hypothetical protein HK405_003273 [Cladochytrium tenue]
MAVVLCASEPLHKSDLCIVHSFKNDRGSIAEGLSYMPSDEAGDELDEAGDELDALLMYPHFRLLLRVNADNLVFAGHKSLRDSMRYSHLQSLIKKRDGHYSLFCACMWVLLNLKDGGKDQEDPSRKLKDGGKDQEDPSRKGKTLVRYAALYWHVHFKALLKDEDIGSLKAEAEVEKFLISNNVILWLEILAKLKELDAARDALRVVIHAKSDKIVDRALALRTVVNVFSDVISGHPEQLKISAAPFAETNCDIVSSFQHDSSSVKIARGGENIWGRELCTQVLAGPALVARSRLDPNVYVLVTSASNTFTICTWNVHLNTLDHINTHYDLDSKFGRAKAVGLVEREDEDGNILNAAIIADKKLFFWNDNDQLNIQEFTLALNPGENVPCIKSPPPPPLEAKAIRDTGGSYQEVLKISDDGTMVYHQVEDEILVYAINAEFVNVSGSVKAAPSANILDFAISTKGFAVLLSKSPDQDESYGCRVYSLVNPSKSPVKVPAVDEGWDRVLLGKDGVTLALCTSHSLSWWNLKDPDAPGRFDNGWQNKIYVREEHEIVASPNLNYVLPDTFKLDEHGVIALGRPCVHNEKANDSEDTPKTKYYIEFRKIDPSTETDTKVKAINNESSTVVAQNSLESADDSDEADAMLGSIFDPPVIVASGRMIYCVDLDERKILSSLEVSAPCSSALALAAGYSDTIGKVLVFVYLNADNNSDANLYCFSLDPTTGKFDQTSPALAIPACDERLSKVKISENESKYVSLEYYPKLSLVLGAYIPDSEHANWDMRTTGGYKRRLTAWTFKDPDNSCPQPSLTRRHWWNATDWAVAERDGCPTIVVADTKKGLLDLYNINDALPKNESPDEPATADDVHRHLMTLPSTVRANLCRPKTGRAVFYDGRRVVLVLNYTRDNPFLVIEIPDKTRTAP